MKKAGKLLLAIEGFRAALKEGSDAKAEAAVHYNLANTLFEERLYDQAIAAYNDAVTSKGDPGFPQGE
jgi:tetratricopeptide (TPR) repeat protein